MCIGLAVTGLVHIVPIFAMGQLFGFRLRQIQAKGSSVRSGVPAFVIDGFPKVVDELGEIVYRRIVLGNNVLHVIRGYLSPFCIRSRNVTTLVICEKTIEELPVLISWCSDGKMIDRGMNIEHPSNFHA